MRMGGEAAVETPGRFSRLFTPGRIGRLQLRNRIIMAPMEKNLGAPDGSVTRRYVDYCEARAAGGAALILLESMYVHPAGKGHVRQLGLHDDALVPGLRGLVDACHRHGALVGAEIYSAGRETSSTTTGLWPVAPSAVPCTALAEGEVPRVLTSAQIEALIEAFAAAAARAVSAGVDLVEIHGAHGYLIGQFLSPYSNRRDDEWGGDFDRRLRLPLAVIGAVRRVVGPAVPLAYRISADEHVPGGLTLADACRIAPYLEAAGVDLLDVSAGIYESAPWIVQPMEMAPACLAPLARALREVVGIPVSVAGRIHDAHVAERVLEAGDADFVSMGRALHADPELPRKSREGREQEICPCLACLSCSDLLGRNEPVLCTANTRTGREREHAIRPTARAERVVIVGAGPAGLEAARVLALRGHDVTVLERAAEPGGQLLLGRAVPGRGDLAALPAYLAGAVARAGARLELGVEATPERILALDPHSVIVATGAAPGVPEIPGIDEAPAVSAFEVLRRPGGRVARALVVGGGVLGVGVAHLLAERGVDVVLAEAGATLAAELGLRPRWQYVAGLRERPNVAVHTRTTVESLGGDRAVLASGDGIVEIAGVDLVVVTWPLVPRTALLEALTGVPGGPAVFAVGDCSRPRTAFDAVHEAAALAHRL